MALYQLRDRISLDSASAQVTATTMQLPYAQAFGAGKGAQKALLPQQLNATSSMNYSPGARRGIIYSRRFNVATTNIFSA
jgi:hypothetical protein